jgi:SAM-dependent methyltransferase
MTPDRVDDEVPAADVGRYFDALGAAEWERHDANLAARVSREVHRRFLARWVLAGSRVLEIGAGPGRFTVELARLGARIVVTDISPIQLDLNARFVAEAGCEAAVERREEVDICDLSRYAAHELGVVLADAGPLSYAFDAAGNALKEMLRVVGTDQPVVASVISTLGSYRHFLPAVVQVMDEFGDQASDRILATGDLREAQPPQQRHSCKIFRWSELQQLAVTPEPASPRHRRAAGPRWATRPHCNDSPDRWCRFLDQETAMCAEPGALDGGTHILFAAIANHGKQRSASVSAWAPYALDPPFHASRAPVRGRRHRHRIVHLRN